MPDSEINWLGRVTLPGPGEARVIALTPATHDTKLSLLALLGPGHYHVADGKIAAIPAPVDTAAGNPIRSYYRNTSAPDGAGENTEIDTTGIELLSMASTGLADGQEDGPPDIFMRDDSERRLPLKTAHGIGATSLLVTPLAPGIRQVEIGLVEVRELKAEFFVKAPPPPAGVAKDRP